MGKTLQECYEVLGLDSSATEDEIKSAYRQKALKCHPDKNPDDPLSTQKFQELGHAYRRLMGEEDSEDDDNYDDEDDMELWRDFFFFLFRDEIMARVRCKCAKCGSRGNEDDDFLASLAKDQEKRQQFTEEEMAQFTSFANLKEQREANKQKFCNRNLSSSKPEQKTTKGHKPKLKSNKQLKREQWKREKEITKIAAEIKQNPKVQEKKPSSGDARKKDLDQEKSSAQPVVEDPKHIVKEQIEHGASNKRNTRKKRNRNNKSRKQDGQETNLNLNSSHRATTLIEHKVSSGFVVQDAVRNVTMKPETTRRQDDVTGRLPRYTSPRMAKSCGGNSAFTNPRNASQKQTGRMWYENPKPDTTSRPTYGSNIWQKRQQKQQFLAELQPSNQTDEELQLQIALELSKKQAEIDAQQREISILERQMEETLELERKLQFTTANDKAKIKAASSTEATNTNAAMETDSFPPLGVPLGDEQGSDAEEEWIVTSGSDDEWGDYACDSNVKDVEGCQAKCSDLEEDQPSKGSASNIEDSERDNVALPKPNAQLAQQHKDKDPQASNCCPYGKNCCLGKRCNYSHPASIDNRKRQKSLHDSSDCQVQCDIKKSESNNASDLVHNLPGKHNSISLVASCEELPMSDTSDASCFVNSNGHSHSTSISDLGESMANNSLPDLQTETCATHSATGDCESLNQPSRNNTADLGSESPAGAWSSSTQEEPKANSTSLNDEKETLARSVGVESVKNESNVPCDNSTPDNKIDTEGKGSPVPADSVIENSRLPENLPAASAMNQSATAIPQLANLLADAKPQNSPQTAQPVNNVKQLPAAMPASVIPPTSAPSPQSAGHTVTIAGSLPGTSQNSGSPSTHQNSAPSQQPTPPVSSIPAQPVVTNNFPAFPGFPFLPFGNLYPFLDPPNAATFNQNVTASLLAAATLSGMPFPVTPGPANGVQYPQGGGAAMNQAMLPPYGTKTAHGSAVSVPGHYLPMTLLNGVSGMPVIANKSGVGPHPLQPSQAGLATKPTSTAPSMSQLSGVSGIPVEDAGTAPATPPLSGFSGMAEGAKMSGTITADPSQAGLATNSQSTAPAMQQPNGALGMPVRANIQGTGAVKPSITGLANSPQCTAPPMPQLTRFSGMPIGANIQGAGTAQPSQAGLATNQQSIAPAMSQLNGFLGLPVGTNVQGASAATSSQAGIATNLQSTAPAMPQLNGALGMSVGASIQGASTVQLSQAGFTNNPQPKVPAMPQLNGCSGMHVGANMQGSGTAKPSQAGVAKHSPPTAVSMRQPLLNEFSGMPVSANMQGTGTMQSSQPGLATNPQSAALNMLQLFRFPFPLVNPQAYVNLNMEMAAMRMQYLAQQNGCQTTVGTQSGSATSQSQVNTNTQKPSEVNIETGKEREGSSGVGTKAPSLRRPVTMPKVIQHKASI